MAQNVNIKRNRICKISYWDFVKLILQENWVDVVADLLDYQPMDFWNIKVLGSQASSAKGFMIKEQSFLWLLLSYIKHQVLRNKKQRVAKFWKDEYFQVYLDWGKFLLLHCSREARIC